MSEQKKKMKRYLIGLKIMAKINELNFKKKCEMFQETHLNIDLIKIQIKRQIKAALQNKKIIKLQN